MDTILHDQDSGKSDVFFAVVNADDVPCVIENTHLSKHTTKTHADNFVYCMVKPAALDEG